MSSQKAPGRKFFMRISYYMYDVNDRRIFLVISADICVFIPCLCQGEEGMRGGGARRPLARANREPVPERNRWGTATGAGLLRNGLSFLYLFRESNNYHFHFRFLHTLGHNFQV